MAVPGLIALVLVFDFFVIGTTRLGGAIGILAVVALFVTILGLPLVSALVLGTLATILGLCLASGQLRDKGHA